MRKHLKKVRKLGLEVSGEFSSNRKNQGKSAKLKGGDMFLHSKVVSAGNHWARYQKILHILEDEALILRHEKWLKGFEQLTCTQNHFDWCAQNRGLGPKANVWRMSLK